MSLNDTRSKRTLLLILSLVLVVLLAAIALGAIAFAVRSYRIAQEQAISGRIEEEKTKELEEELEAEKQRLQEKEEEIERLEQQKEMEEEEEKVKEEPVKEEPKLLKVGETGHGKTWDYTVNSYKIKDQINGSDFKGGPLTPDISAGERQRFLIVNVTFKNTTKNTSYTSTLDSHNLTAHAAGGLNFDECKDSLVTYALGDSYYIGGSVAPGVATTGNIPFKISAKATGITFKIDYGNLIWKLE